MAGQNHKHHRVQFEGWESWPSIPLPRSLVSFAQVFGGAPRVESDGRVYPLSVAEKLGVDQICFEREEVESCKVRKRRVLKKKEFEAITGFRVRW